MKSFRAYIEEAKKAKFSVVNDKGEVLSLHMTEPDAKNAIKRHEKSLKLKGLKVQPLLKEGSQIDEELLDEGLKDLIKAIKASKEYEIASNVQRMIKIVGVEETIKRAKNLDRRQINKVRAAIKHQSNITDPDMKEFARQIGAL